MSTEEQKQQGQLVQLTGSDEIISEPDQPLRFRRKTTRLVKKPVITKRKVPVTTQRVVPCEETKRVKAKKLVQIADFEEVDEEYTVYEEQQATRKKEVKELKIENEVYDKKVPVVKTRTVKKPITRFEEVDVYQEVEFQTTKVVELVGYRIDEIETTAIVETEEWEVYELSAHGTGQVFEGAKRDLDVIQNGGGRRTGDRVILTKYDKDAQVDLAEFEEDTTIGQPETKLPVDVGEAVVDFSVEGRPVATRLSDLRVVRATKREEEKAQQQPSEI